jgi:ribose 1,5-bisphosphokinase
VTEAPAIPDHEQAPAGPGRLVLVVGPSGAGKDTLIGLARTALAGNGSVVFPRRLVTREASPSEDNEYASSEAFQFALSRGDLAIHWKAHGHCYGLPRSIVDDINAGRTVVVNVSRTVVEAMRRTYGNVVVISITAPSEILAERLAVRARPSDGQLADRLHRAVDVVAPDVTIVNVGNVETRAAEFIQLIKGA